MNREEDFSAIREATDLFIRLTKDRALLAAGDALQVLKLFPAQSISLILTDPPYHSTNKGGFSGHCGWGEQSDTES